MDSDKIIEQLEMRIQGNPKSLVFAHLADLYIDENKLEEAIQLCQEGVRSNPEYMTGHFILAKAFLKNESNDQAEDALKKVLSHDNEFLAAHKLLGDLMLKMGFENKAAQHYKEILRIDPLDKETESLLHSLGITDFGQLEEEEPELEEETSFTPATKDDWSADIREVFPDSPADSPDTDSSVQDQLEITAESQSNSIKEEIDNLFEDIPEPIQKEKEEISPKVIDDFETETPVTETEIHEDSIADKESQPPIEKEKISPKVIDDFETKSPVTETEIHEDIITDKESQPPIEDVISESIEEIAIDENKPNDIDESIDSPAFFNIAGDQESVEPEQESPLDHEILDDFLKEEPEIEVKVEDKSEVEPEPAKEEDWGSAFSFETIEEDPVEKRESTIDAEITVREDETLSFDENIQEPDSLLIDQTDSQTTTEEDELKNVEDVFGDFGSSETEQPDESETLILAPDTTESEDTFLGVQENDEDQFEPTTSEEVDLIDSLDEIDLSIEVDNLQVEEIPQEVELPEESEITTSDFEEENISLEEISLEDTPLEESIEEETLEETTDEEKYSEQSSDIDVIKFEEEAEAVTEEKTDEEIPAPISPEVTDEKESEPPIETESIMDAFQEGIDSEEDSSKSPTDKIPEKVPQENKKEEESRTEAVSETKKPKIVTPTLGEIYAAQGQYDKAIKVFQDLLEQNPKEIKYQQKIDEIQQKLKESL